MTDPIIAVARFIADHLEWMRHRAEVDEFLADVDSCARVVRGIARGPGEHRFLGPCGADVCGTCGCLPDWHVGGKCRNGQRLPHRCEGDFDIVPCEGDVYAPLGGSTGRCRSCTAEVSVRDRQAWLDELVRSHAFTDVDIADALRIPVKTIRSWATERPESRNHEGKLTRSASPAKLRAHGHDRDGKPLYLLGDVADLAAADAARRETNRNRRPRTETAA